MKNFIISLLLFILFSFSFSACKKTVFNRSVKGRVIDITTGEPIANAFVSLRAEQSTFLGSGNSYIEEESKTDKNGYYEFSYRKNRKYNYNVYAGAENYFFIASKDYASVDFGKSKIDDIKITPKAILNINVNRKTNAQYVYVKIMNGYGGGDEEVSSQNKTISFNVSGNQEINVKYIIYQNSTINITYDTSIYCSAFQSNYLKINY